MKKIIHTSILCLSIISCKPFNEYNQNMTKKLNEYAEVKLTSDISDLTTNQKEMLQILFDVAQIMDDLFWIQAYNSKDIALNITSDSATKEFIKINYGPWDRLNGNKPFVKGVGEKPKGAKFYPTDITKQEFDSLESDDKKSWYTVLSRNESGDLITIPYSTKYKQQLEKASGLIKKASILAEDDGFKKYLELRANALLTDKYFKSDMAWMDMKSNRIDFIVGPIENYEDKLYGYKTSFEAYILLKDMEWSSKLDKFSELLPDMQKRLPVDEKYKQEKASSNSDLGAYDVVYYAGDCNAATKTIAINLPNDPNVYEQKGSRRLQLKNAMKAKFDKILVPISEMLIDDKQQQHITFDAFFENTMFHEVAHGIGVHYTINSGEQVRTVLKDKYSALEEGKADILGLFLVDELVKMGELESDKRNNYVTFTAGLFRSIRFGASSAHGIANLVRYNYFKEHNAFTRDNNGIYTVNFSEMRLAVENLTRKIITIQGDGDYEAATELLDKYGIMPDDLKHDLSRINNNDIPKDIKFVQGAEILGL